MPPTKTTTLIAIFGAAVLLSACESDLRLAGGAHLEPMNDRGEYRWKTFADPVYPIDSEKAEAARLRQLDTTLMMNGVCAGGYIVADRQATLRVSGGLGGAYDVFYTVKCK